MELGRGSFAEMEWPFIYLFIIYIYLLFIFLVYLLIFIVYLLLNIVFPAKTKNKISIFFCFTPRNSSSARLGQNSRASTSMSSIEKKAKRSSSLN